MSRFGRLTKKQQKAVVKASLLKPLNLGVLAFGVLSGVFATFLIPLGVVAYGILCCLDVSSEEFITTALRRARCMLQNSSQSDLMASAPPRSVPQFRTKELRSLSEQLSGIQTKLERLSARAADLPRSLLEVFADMHYLLERSDSFLRKAQQIQEYLASEDLEQISQNITALQNKIQRISDRFSKEQYQQALDTRYHHLETLRDIQQMYERLVSQVTNISILLESVYSQMMRWQTSKDTFASAESEPMADELRRILHDADQLDSVLKDQFFLPE